MGRPTRRAVLLASGAALLAAVGARWMLPRLWRTGPVRPLDAEERAFVDGLCAGLEPARRVDCHVHLIGRGDGGTGCRMGALFDSPWHPWYGLVADAVLAASGIHDDGDGVDLDALYLARLLERHRAHPAGGRMLLLAFDAVVGEDGRVDDARTLLHTPDDYVLAVAAREPDVLPCVSVHPYRRDAPDRVQDAAARGAVACKWLPSTMGIDPASPLCDPFYRSMAREGLVLLTHAGRESTLGAFADQRLGHPLRLRRALDAGVRVLVAHCGSLGSGADLDDPTAPDVTFLAAFLRLMDDPRYDGLLLGDISGLTFVDRSGAPLRAILERPHLHARLVDGSDYPMCALDPVTSTRGLARDGLLSEESRRLCERVFDANPLAFDFAVKRSVRLLRNGREERLGDAMFQGVEHLVRV